MPFRVAHLCGRVGAVDGVQGNAVRLQPLHGALKQGVLGLGVGFVFRRGAVCHGKMLENTAEVQLGQGGAALHGSDCCLKVRTHAEPNASHTSIHLKVAVYLHAGVLGGSGKRLGILFGIDGLGNAAERQLIHLQRVGVAQDQDGFADPVAAQVPRFGQAADRKSGCAVFFQPGPSHSGAVAVSVRLDNAAHRRAHRLLDQCQVALHSIQINQCPTMLFVQFVRHCNPPHFDTKHNGESSPVCARYAAAASRQCRFAAKRAVFSDGKPGRPGSSAAQTIWSVRALWRHQPGSGF